MSLVNRTNRVVNWLREVDSGQGFSKAPESELTEQSEWNLVNTVDTGFFHPGPSRHSGLWFSVGESGSIGTSLFKTRPDESTISILYPSNPTNPVTLVSGSDRVYTNSVFIKQSGREYLAVHCFTDASIHLWDTVNRTSRVVYREGLQRDKDMLLCPRDSETIVYGECKSIDGICNVYLLNTSTEQWSLRTMFRLQIGLEFVTEMCYVSLADAIPCLVFCSTRSLVAVEMLDGKILWHLGGEQMGEGFIPVSVCTDTDNNVYVSDIGYHRVYMLSAEDGSVITTVLNVQQHGIFYPFCLQIYKGHLYVGHYGNPKSRKWVISKFAKNKLNV